MAWNEFNAASLFPGPTKAVLETTGDAAEIVATSAETLASGLDVLADILTAIASEKLPIIQLLKNLIEDVLNTGIYVYYDLPSLPLFPPPAFSWEDMRREMNIDGVEDERRQAAAAAGETYVPPVLPLEPSRTHGFTGWKAKWQQSFSDAGDEFRPEFSEDAAVSCVIFMAGTPSLDALPTLLKALGMLFGIGAFKDLLDRLFITRLAEDAAAGDRTITVERADGLIVDRDALIGPLSGTFAFANIKSVNTTTNQVGLYEPLFDNFSAGQAVAMTAMGPSVRSSSRAPDWQSIRVSDIPPVHALANQIKRLLGLLDIGEGILAMLAKLAEALAEKADQLRALADEIVDLIELIESILALTGVYIVKLDSTTGIQGLFDALEDEGNPPLPAASFVAGVCILAGTADFAGFGDMLGV